ncbi:hypothetical protein BJ508DRAFT_211298 [Ascobolus immersus RN42]|uniref:Nephrocystin 3-like N-terminal domain-containing protein n=1 Tax=Ascobolus immersus RN42 TaxID=1160509 RepID=A0A3N4I1A1_ASCIM|nr:hypothetical protein BJ508DRAFT_211298 [Ascobolus immersus RN42]
MQILAFWVPTHQSENQAESTARMLSWLSSMCYTAEQERKNEKRVQGTGNWFLQEPNYVSWRDSDKRRELWCYGHPGVGKSFISSIIIEDLKAGTDSKPNKALAYIYGNYKDWGPDAKDYIACILKQIVQQLRVVPEEISLSYNRHNLQGASHRPRLAEVLNLLEKATEPLNRVYVVIDALDECKRPGIADDVVRYTLINKLRSFKKISLLVTSRSALQLEDLFENTPKVQIVARESDIRALAYHYMSTDNISPSLAEKLAGKVDLKYEIASKVIEVSENR